MDLKTLNVVLMLTLGLILSSILGCASSSNAFLGLKMFEVPPEPDYWEKQKELAAQEKKTIQDQLAAVDKRTDLVEGEKVLLRKKIVQDIGKHIDAFEYHQILAEIDYAYEDFQRKQRVKEALNATGEKAEQIRQQPIVVVKAEARTRGGATLRQWYLELCNRSSRPIGNIRYRTRYYSQTHVLVGAGGIESPFGGPFEGIIMKIIQPGEQREMIIDDGFVYPQTAYATFEVVSWEWMDE